MRIQTLLATLAILPLAITGCSAPAGDGAESTSQGLDVVVRLPIAIGGTTQFTRFARGGKPTRIFPVGLGGLKRLASAGSGGGTTQLQDINSGAPAAVDLSQWAPTPGDQGQYGSCASWAGGYSTMGWWLNKSGVAGNPLNPMFLYAQVMAETNQACSATSGSAIEQPLDLLQQEGIDTLNDFPSTTCVQPTQAQIQAAAPYKISGYHQISLQGGAQQALTSAVAAGSPVVIGIAVFDEFMNASASNGYLVGAPGPSSQYYGGHAISVQKYDDKGVWILNSWGAGWGNQGWAELSWDYLNASFQDQGQSYAVLMDAASIDGLAGAAPSPNPNPNPNPPPPSGPTAQFVSPTNGQTLPAETVATLSVSASDTGAQLTGATVTITGPYGTHDFPLTDSGGGQYTGSVTFGVAGQRTLALTVTDSSGQTTSSTETITIQ